MAAWYVFGSKELGRSESSVEQMAKGSRRRSSRGRDIGVGGESAPGCLRKKGGDYYARVRRQR